MIHRNLYGFDYYLVTKYVACQEENALSSDLKVKISLFRHRLIYRYLRISYLSYIQNIRFSHSPLN